MASFATTALILAAGTSGRMGFPKLLLPFSDDRCFLQEIVNQYASLGCQQIIVVINASDYDLIKHHAEEIVMPEIELVVNEAPQLGRFRSIRLGLDRLNIGHACFLQNIDNPFVDLTLLKELEEKLRSNVFVVPEFDEKRGHPVLLSPEVCGELLRVQQNEANLRELLHQYSHEVVKTSNPKVLLNINSPEMYFEVFGRMPEKIKLVEPNSNNQI